MFHKMLEIPWVVEQLLASHEGLCSTEFVSFIFKRKHCCGNIFKFQM
jgi:hypothetical protein